MNASEYVWDLDNQVERLNNQLANARDENLELKAEIDRLKTLLIQREIEINRLSRDIGYHFTYSEV